MFKTLSKTIACSLLVALPGINAIADVTAVSEQQLVMNKELAEDVHQALYHLRYAHYLPNELNDETSESIFEKYFETLDPNKAYFTKEDLADFEKYRFKIDDMLKQRDAELAFTIFKVFRNRLEQRTTKIEKLIQQDFDFSKDESFNIDNDSREWAVNEAELDEFWRKRIKNNTLQQLMDETPIAEIRTNLSKRYQRQKDVIFQLKADDVFEWYMNSYTKNLGPHTQYMSHTTSENFRISMSLSLEGIGAVLSSDQDYTVINRIMPGGPAERSGLLGAEDKIVAVGQDGEEMINVIGWRLTDVVKMIRGDKGTKVKLDIIKSDSVPGSPPDSIELVRDVIHLEDQEAKLTEVQVPNGDTSDTFSVIRIPSFYSNAAEARNGAVYSATSHDVKKLLKQVNESKSKGLVIDLRGNGGGYLNEAINLTGLFIPRGPVVQVVTSNKKRQVLSDLDSSVSYSGPMVVLVDRFSASASEIFAAAMQDYGRAIIVGERSFGKGTVQNVSPLRYGKSSDHESMLKLTTAQFFRVNGGSTQHLGVSPDITLNAGAEDEEFGERAYDNALPWSEIKAANYQSTAFSKEMINELQSNHQARSNDSAAFEFLRQNSERITDNRNMKELSLNLEGRKVKRDKLQQESLDELNQYRKSLGLETVTKETRKDSKLPDEDEHWNIVYHTEAAKILNDYLNWDNTLLTRNAQNKQNSAN